MKYLPPHEQIKWTGMKTMDYTHKKEHILPLEKETHPLNYLWRRYVNSQKEYIDM